MRSTLPLGDVARHSCRAVLHPPGGVTRRSAAGAIRASEWAQSGRIAFADVVDFAEVVDVDCKLPGVEDILRGLECGAPRSSA